MALLLNAVPAATRTLLGLTNGRSSIIPSSSVSSYIAANHRLVLVDQGAGLHVFDALAQYAWMVNEGAPEVDAGLLTGIRSGFLNAVALTRFKLGGTTHSDLATMMAAGVDVFGRIPDETAAQGIDLRLHLRIPVDDAAMAALFTPGYKTDGPASIRVAPADVANDKLNLRYRTSETVLLDPTYDLVQATVDGFVDPASAGFKAYLEGCDFAINALGLVVLHLMKSDGHHWMTKVEANVCYNALVKVMRGAKVQRKEAFYMKLLHDCLHCFEGLVALFNTMYALPGIELWLNDAMLWRYPPTISGTAIITSTDALIVQCRNMVGLHQPPAGSMAIFDAAATAVIAMKLDLVTNATRWSARVGPDRERRNAKLTAAKEIGAFVRGFAIGIGMNEEATALNATSVANAGDANPARFELGKQQAAAIKATAAPTALDVTNTGMGQVIASFIVAW